MLFVSQVFIFAFLPISVIGFYAMRRTLGNGAALAWLALQRRGAQNRQRTA